MKFVNAITLKSFLSALTLILCCSSGWAQVSPAYAPKDDSNLEKYKSQAPDSGPVVDSVKCPDGTCPDYAVSASHGDRKIDQTKNPGTPQAPAADPNKDQKPTRQSHFETDTFRAQHLSKILTGVGADHILSIRYYWYFIRLRNSYPGTRVAIDQSSNALTKEVRL